MIDLTNNFNEISSILGDSSEEEISSFCQARSAETIWPFHKKGAHGFFEEGSSNENLLADDSKTSNTNNQKDQKGTLTFRLIGIKIGDMFIHIRRVFT